MSAGPPGPHGSMDLMSATERKLSYDLVELKEEIKEVQEYIKLEIASLQGEQKRFKTELDNLRNGHNNMATDYCSFVKRASSLAPMPVTPESTALEPFRNNCSMYGTYTGEETFQVRPDYHNMSVRSDLSAQKSSSSPRFEGVLPGQCAGGALVAISPESPSKPSDSGVKKELDVNRSSENGAAPMSKLLSCGPVASDKFLTVKHLMNDESGTSADVEEVEEGEPFLDHNNESGAPNFLTQMTKTRNSGFKNLVQAHVHAANRQTHLEINVILEDEHSHHKSRCILTPNGRVARTWQKLTALAVIYIVGVVSFDMGFNWWKISHGMYVWGHIVDMWFWADMIVTFRTAYIHGGHLVMDAKKIAQHYFHFWFWVDLTANVPWERLMMVSKSNRKAIKFLKWLKLPRLLRLGRLRKLMKANARYLNLVILLSSVFLSIHIGACAMVWFADPCSAYVDEEPFSSWNFLHEVDDSLVARHPRLGWECMQESINSIYFKALHESSATLLGVDKGTLMSYITGGGESISLLEEVRRYAGYLMDTEESAARDPSAARTRAVKLALLQRRYPLSLADSDQFGGMSCFPWRATGGSESATENCTGNYFSGFNTQKDMNTFGLAFHAPMDVFGALMLMFGLYLQGLLFANLTRLLIARHHSETAFRQKHDEVKRELELYGPLIPESVQKRIEKHFEFRWINQAYGPLQLLKPDLLSLSLRGELALYLYRTAVTKVEFLQDAPLSILTKVCLNLEPQDYMLRDTIYRRGEYPSGIYLIDKGKVLLTVSDKALANEESHGGRISKETMALAQEVGSGAHFGTGAAIAAIQVSAEQDTVHVANKKSAIAMTVCHLLCLSIKLFREICDAHPKFFWELKHLDEAEQPQEDEEEDDGGKHDESNGHEEPEYVAPSTLFRKSLMMKATGLEDTSGMADRLKRMHQEVQSHGGKLDEIVSSLETLVLRMGSQRDVK